MPEHIGLRTLEWTRRWTASKVAGVGGGVDSFGLINLVSRILIVLMLKGFSGNKQKRQNRSQNPVRSQPSQRTRCRWSALSKNVKFVSGRSECVCVNL
jgi:hypothetical protein